MKKSDQVSQYLAFVWTVHGRIVGCYHEGNMPKSVPHVLIIHLFFVPFSATNCLQNYNIFPKRKAFLKNILKKMSAFFVVECFFPTFAPNKPTKHNKRKKKLTHRHT